MDEEQKNKGITVDFGQIFLDGFTNYLIKDIEKINDFINHLSIHGFDNLAGRNKPSHNVDSNDHKFVEKVQHAQKHNLWHYHIGIPNYDQTNNHGDWTSKYILHYIRLDNSVKIVDLDSHPPFNLPAEEYLK